MRIEIHKVTKCPHCLVAFHGSWHETDLGTDADGRWTLHHTECPTCERLVMVLNEFSVGKGKPSRLRRETIVRPRISAREPLSPDVPDTIKKDYLEACLVLNDSPKASAALSRRCLQHLLREKAGIKRGNLADEIQQVLDAKILPPQLAEDIDGVRNVGNFAAHPEKSTKTGEIIDVEPGEAEWLLTTLEGLFDFFYVQPAAHQRRRDAVNAKLKEAGKAPMKKK